MNEAAKERENASNAEQFKASCRALIGQVSKEVVMKANKILEQDSPADFVKLVETFVALLRAKPRSKPVDVELFFADHSKLISKMARVETTQCSMELIKDSFETLNAIRQGFGVGSTPDLSPFQCFLDWSKNYCQASEIDLKIVTLEQEVAQLSLDLERAEVAVQSYDRMEQDANQFNFRSYFELAINTCNNNLDVLGAIVDTDFAQAESYQRELKSFEDMYFKEYMSIAQGQ